MALKFITAEEAASYVHHNDLSLIHISEPTNYAASRMPSSA